MSDTRQGPPSYPPEFLANVDKFVNLANEMAKEIGTGSVSAAILFAAGRYNSFNYLTQGGSEEDPSEAVTFYTNEYRKAFQQNLAGVVGSVISKPN